MKHSGDVDVSAAEQIMEVELSADELQALPSTREVVLAQSASEPCSGVSEPTASIKQQPPKHSWLSSLRQLSATRVLGSVAVAIIASIAVRAQYQESTPQQMAPTSTLAWSQIPPRPATVETEESAATATPTPTLLPTFFENPFDRTEVFQFPPGTSHEEARAMVADLLMKRARERLAR